MNEAIPVYFRRDDGKLGQMDVVLEDTETHADAILKVEKDLVDSGEGYNNPVLAFIKGGKYGPA